MRLIITAILIYILYKLFIKGGRKKPYREDSEIRGSNSDVGEMVQDPVCKVYIPMDQAYMRIIDGKKYYFCSKECADAFEKKSKDFSKP